MGAVTLVSIDVIMFSKTNAGTVTFAVVSVGMRYRAAVLKVIIRAGVSWVNQLDRFQLGRLDVRGYADVVERPRSHVAGGRTAGQESAEQTSGQAVTELLEHIPSDDPLDARKHADVERVIAHRHDGCVSEGEPVGELRGDFGQILGRVYCAVGLCEA